MAKLASGSIVALSELVNGQEADLFVLMTAKEELTTRDGKPYFRVGFRDHAREVSFPVWHDSPWGQDCRAAWQPGTFYKLRAVYRETSYGPQLELRKIREVCEADTADGFSPAMCRAAIAFRSRRDVRGTAGDLAREQHRRRRSARVGRRSAADQSRGCCSTLPAATHNHHAFVGGWLEHVLSVTRTLRLPGRQVRRVLSRLAPRLNKGPGRRRRDPARHRQAARDRAAAARRRVHGGGQPDRPHPARARHRPRSGCRSGRSIPSCCCGWSISSSRTSGCPSGDRPSRR